VQAAPMVVDLYNAMLQEVDFEKLKGGGEFGIIFLFTPLSEIFQKSGRVRKPLYVRDC
jgi:hypothetical protein